MSVRASVVEMEGSAKKRIISIWHVGLHVSGGNLSCGAEL